MRDGLSTAVDGPLLLLPLLLLASSLRMSGSGSEESAAEGGACDELMRL